MPPNQKGREPSPYPRNFRTRSPSKKDARAINNGSAQLHLRMPEDGSAPWALACSEYGERFVCAVRQGQCVATQFHPEKSGTASGLKWQLRAGEKTQQPGHTNTSSSDSLEDVRGNPKRSAQFRHIHYCISIIVVCHFLPPLQIAFFHVEFRPSQRGYGHPSIGILQLCCQAGLKILETWLSGSAPSGPGALTPAEACPAPPARRIIACGLGL